jgi:GntR family transcriptional regulator/MocR family aminotransferase
MAFVSVDRGASRSLIGQVYDQIRDLILAGTLRCGTKLPSTRALALELAVSRNVVLEAYEQLLAEGYLETRAGSGSYVAAGAAFDAAPETNVDGLRLVGFKPFRVDLVDFRSGLPDLSRFPVRTWRRLSREVWEGITPRDLAYSQPEGRPELREAIARYISAHRGVRCHPDQVLVTAGTTQAVGIVSRLLLQGGNKTCVLEDPVTIDIQHIISGFGGRVIPVPVDEQGLQTDALPTGRIPGFIYVTPSHQFPLGVTMPIQRRVGLLEYAQRSGAYIVEDDYDSEFRYESPPVSSIQGLDPQRVVYIGTFSKTLCPAMRIGYIVFPPDLVNRGRQVKWFIDLHNASVDQLILARFISEGYFLRHVSNMKKVHRQKRKVLVEAITACFSDTVTLLGASAGLHLCVRFPGIEFTPTLLEELERRGLVVYPVEEHAIRKGRYRDTVILGFGMLEVERIQAGIKILRRCIAGSG